MKTNRAIGCPPDRFPCSPVGFRVKARPAAEAGLGFAKLGEALMPPEALAAAFEDEPGLQPPVFMRGPVLARDVLGDGARKLLARAGLLQELTRGDLAGAGWGGGGGW